jgi:DNA-3-methyladenine glycosylase I
MQTFDYKTTFDKVESSLIMAGSKHLLIDKIRTNLDAFKYGGSLIFSDAEYFEKLVFIIFYSGFKAAIVGAKSDMIRYYFPGFQTVSGYTGTKVEEILNNPKMIRNRRKVEACIENARVFTGIVSEYGSFQTYIDSFAPNASFENLMLLKEELEYRFNGLGRITTYHFLTDIGMPVLKPDRVICRIFERLGLLESEEQLLKAVIQGRKFAEATGYPIRYIDIVFVSYGQMESKEFGLTSGICLEKKPHCELCDLLESCKYYALNRLFSQ